VSPGVAFAMAPCYLHKGLFCFDPESVTSLRIDPQTGRPPDVNANGEPAEPSQAAQDRSVREPICPDCCKRVNPDRRALGLELLPEGDSMDNLARLLKDPYS